MMFVGPGDSILPATSDYGLLTTYAARRTNGSLSLLVISKDSVTNLSGQISLAGFLPGPNATIYSYGMAQDNAAEAGSSACDIATKLGIPRSLVMSITQSRRPVSPSWTSRSRT